MFNKKKKKDIPYIARVNIAEEMKKRMENMELGDKSILARADYSLRYPRIRLMYVRFEKFLGHTDSMKLATTLGVSSPFMIPKGMGIENACKIVSYLSEKLEKEYNVEPASEDSVALVSRELANYGFEKLECDYTPGHYHSISQYHLLSKIETEFDEGLKATTDLITYDGNKRLFKKSVLGSKYFNWFTENVTKEDVIDIYYDSYITPPEVVKTR